MIYNEASTQDHMDTVLCSNHTMNGCFIECGVYNTSVVWDLSFAPYNLKCDEAITDHRLVFFYIQVVKLLLFIQRDNLDK